MNRQQRIESSLKTLAPTFLEVINDSEKHKNHADHLGGAGQTGETHYKVKISSPLFVGLSRLDCHRKINEALAEEFKLGLHALEIKIIF
jgi:BolA family transcriptional regulator, general stress-responsive regulator